MPQLDIAHAKVRLDDYTVIARGKNNPLNWTEIELMWFQHGERAVSDIVIVDTVETTNMEVLENLRLKYGAGAVSEAFPGQRPRLPMQAPEEFTRLNAPAAKPKPKKRASRKKPEKPVEDALADMMAAEPAPTE